MKRLVAFVAALLLAAVGGVLFLVPSNHYLFLPDPARPVDPLVKVPGEETGDSRGGLYMVDILVRRATLFERLFPGVAEGSSLVPEGRVNPGGVSEEERRRHSLREMSASQKIAVAVALRSLGYKVPTNTEVADVERGAPADGKLRRGDIILNARGTAVRSPVDLFDIMRAHRPGDPVQVTIRREGRVHELEVGTRAADDDSDRAVMGVFVEVEIDPPVNVRIDAGDIGGPSAGLAFALDIVDELGRDVDRGRRVAVTGALGLDGTVDAIGGIKQKAIGAREAGAEVFIVPRGNAKEARSYAEGLEIVAVRSFADALARLTTP
ncbi:MAG: PDZ domain-containing protein [Actinomycetota bacterium]|nr:PDZ domain-containing protein [Actinomycetota bacterium]